jgi:hypothetical protein
MLTLLSFRATETLCINDTCIDEATLESLLELQQQQSNPSVDNANGSEVDDDTSSSSDDGTQPPTDPGSESDNEEVPSSPNP